MKMILGTLADYASDAGRGKLTMVGVFDHVFDMTGARPIAMPECTIVIVASASVAEGSQHRVVLTLEDADGEALNAIEAPLMFVARGPGYPLRAQLLINLRGFMVPDIGDYVFRVRVNENELGDIPLYIVEPPEPIKRQLGSRAPIAP